MSQTTHCLGEDIYMGLACLRIWVSLDFFKQNIKFVRLFKFNKKNTITLSTNKNIKYQIIIMPGDLSKNGKENNFSLQAFISQKLKF